MGSLSRNYSDYGSPHLAAGGNCITNEVAGTAAPGLASSHWSPRLLGTATDDFTIHALVIDGATGEPAGSCRFTASYQLSHHPGT